MIPRESEHSCSYGTPNYRTTFIYKSLRIKSTQDIFIVPNCDGGLKKPISLRCIQAALML
jgi:hypothetical protein